MNTSTTIPSTAAIEAKVLELLLNVAPDVDRTTLKRDLAFRAQFDFDSMDMLNFAIALSKAFGIDIPETAYPQLASLAQAVTYVDTALRRRVAVAAAS